MSLSEFEIIRQVFTEQSASRADVVIGIGDDAAVLTILNDHELAITVDTLIENVHFPASMSPRDVGYRSLAVNLSDLAAMGAVPSWITLAISLPEPNDLWLNAFASGLFSLTQAHNVQLIGGDTTRGPLSITIQAMGFLPKGERLTRSGAKVGDLICVTGMLGEAAAGLQFWSDRNPQYQRLRQRLARPEPRLQEGQFLREHATSALDISDGLLADLSHILDQSKVGATLQVGELPLSISLCDAVGLDRARELALTGGDDYELCFTLPAEKLEMVKGNIPVNVIGKIDRDPGLRYLLPGGEPMNLQKKGYQHF